MSYATPRKRKYTNATRLRNKERNIARALRQQAAAKAKVERRKRRHPAKHLAAA